MMISANASTQVKEGTFANADYPNATWTWSYHDDGTLYIGGTGTGTTEFFYGGNSSDAGKKNIPWLNGTLRQATVFQREKEIAEHSEIWRMKLTVQALPVLTYMTRKERRLINASIDI